MVDRLFVYGTLKPGGAAGGLLGSVDGRFRGAALRGVLHADGLPSTGGYPVLELDPDGPYVEGMVFESEALPVLWPALDAYEGPAYRRVLADVTRDDGALVRAQVYVLADGMR